MLHKLIYVIQFRKDIHVFQTTKSLGFKINLNFINMTTHIFCCYISKQNHKKRGLVLNLVLTITCFV